ncbi:unnamed protein product [Sphacelaria rigidula]
MLTAERDKLMDIGNGLRAELNRVMSASYQRDDGLEAKIHEAVSRAQKETRKKYRARVSEVEAAFAQLSADNRRLKARVDQSARAAAAGGRGDVVDDGDYDKDPGDYGGSRDGADAASSDSFNRDLGEVGDGTLRVGYIDDSAGFGRRRRRQRQEQQQTASFPSGRAREETSRRGDGRSLGDHDNHGHVFHDGFVDSAASRGWAGGGRNAHWNKGDHGRHRRTSSASEFEEGGGGGGDGGGRGGGDRVFLTSSRSTTRHAVVVGKRVRNSTPPEEEQGQDEDQIVPPPPPPPPPRERRARNSTRSLSSSSSTSKQQTEGQRAAAQRLRAWQERRRQSSGSSSNFNGAGAKGSSAAGAGSTQGRRDVTGCEEDALATSRRHRRTGDIRVRNYNITED